VVDDPSVHRAVEAALVHDDLEALLTSLIRIALGRRPVIEAAIARADAAAEAGSAEHADAARRLRRALELTALWGDGPT
jgi:hypothetical protein